VSTLSNDKTLLCDLTTQMNRTSCFVAVTRPWPAPCTVGEDFFLRSSDHLDCAYVDELFTAFVLMTRPFGPRKGPVANRPSRRAVCGSPIYRARIDLN